MCRLILYVVRAENIYSYIDNNDLTRLGRRTNIVPKDAAQHILKPLPTLKDIEDMDFQPLGDGG
jgi:hypothetical protein